MFIVSMNTFCLAAVPVNPFHKEIKWKAPQNSTRINVAPVKLLAFEGASYQAENKGLPTYSQTFYFNKKGTEPVVELLNQKFETIAETNLITNKNAIANEVKVVSKLLYFKKSSYVNVSFIPIRKNPSTGAFERLVSYDVSITAKPSAQKSLMKNAQTFAANSVLSSGNWYRIAVVSDGIYELNYSFLKSLGMPVDKINPKSIRVYGNGGAMLPYPNSVFRHDDLVENPIQFFGNAMDSVIKQNDYFLFFGQGPNRWLRNTAADSACHPFSHVVNVYSDTSFYFITADMPGNGKRVITNPSSSNSPNTPAVTTFNDYAYHEADLVTLLKSGRQWYGEAFDILPSYTFNFNFPNIDCNTQASITADVAANYASANTNFTFSNNGSNVMQLSVPANTQGGLDGPVALDDSGCSSFNNNCNPLLNITVSYANPGNATAWLTYFDLNVRRHLTLSNVGNEMLFRERSTVGIGNVTEFDIAAANQNFEVWDVTDPTNEFVQGASLSGGTLSFVIANDNQHEFMAFDSTKSFPTPVADGLIGNQNLHATAEKDFIIVAHPDFVDQAVQLGNFHVAHDSLSYIVVTPQQIYNEFSSGKQDVTAIRSFVKMFYDRAGTDSTKLPKYLLLFGDGSYDPKNRTQNNTDYVVAFENANSTVSTSSYVSDDFFGLLDDIEGTYDDATDSGLPDVGIGRLPVDNASEAQAVVNKIIHYLSPPSTLDGVSSCSITSNSVYGDWRNKVCFVAGDKEGGIFVGDAENMFTQVNTNHQVYNVNKIYFDAYQEESTPGGQRYPDVNLAITNQIEKGCLIMNYTGHGGQAGWGFERCLDDGMINSWNNYNNLACFFTATCQFSEWDDPTLVSAGENCLLNPNGGAICLFSTVRLVYEAANEVINGHFYDQIFTPINNNGKMPSTGLIMELIKVEGGGTNTNDRNFSLLGDPALTLAYPHYNVITTAVNGVTLTAVPDTMKALEKVTISGYIADYNNNKLTNFNGYMYPTVYDKFDSVSTLGNDPTSPIIKFALQQSIIYNGKSKVTNGNFSYTFIVPKDISFQYGFGKLSYYGYNTATDANGYYNHIVVGGYNKNAPKDTIGPSIKLYINDDKFIYGGATDANPIIYAVLTDSSGINTVGNGIGHDITAQLDGDNSKIYVLNDYYQADLDNYQKGTVFYPLTNLAAGHHTLTFKAWDVYNNSSTANLEFVVEASSTFQLAHVLNYPNPFTTHTSFFFEHNCPCEDLNVMIQVFTVTGKLIKTINTDMHTEGYRSTGIDWDGKDDYNDRIGRGVYIYRMKVRKPDGEIASKIEKLVILH